MYAYQGFSMLGLPYSSQGNLCAFLGYLTILVCFAPNLYVSLCGYFVLALMILIYCNSSAFIFDVVVLLGIVNLYRYMWYLYVVCWGC